MNNSDNMNASAYTNIPLVTISGSGSGAKIGLTTNVTHITSINVEYGGIGYREGDFLKVLGSTLSGRESDIFFTLDRNDLKSGVVSSRVEARPLGNGFVRQPFVPISTILASILVPTQVEMLLLDVQSTRAV